MASPSKSTLGVPVPPPLPLDIKSHHSQANQEKLLRPLFWKRLHLSSTPGNVVWQHVTQPPFDDSDIATLQKLFPRKSSRSKDKQRERKYSIAPLRILETRRSQAIAIFLRGIHVDVMELSDALLALDTSAVDSSTIKAACELVGYIPHTTCMPTFNTHDAIMI